MSPEQVASMAKGIFEGGLFGIRGRRQAAQYELERRDHIAGLDIGVDELIASTADPDEARAWRDRFESAKELALSHDELQQREGLNQLSTMATAVQAAVDRRHKAQEDFVIEEARTLRTQHTEAMKPMRELQANMEQLNALLADPEFNQNLPINRGTLISLLRSSTRQMLSDPEDFADALMGAGGGGLIASLVKFAGGAMAAEDFNFTKDDYGRLARAMYTFNEKRYRTTVAPIAAQAAALEQVSGKLDFLPQGYSLTQYVTGPPEEFENPLKGDYGVGFENTRTAPLETARDALSSMFEDSPSSEGEAGARAAVASPNFSGVTDADAPWLDRVLGITGPGIQLNSMINTAAELGGTVRANPDTGALYSFFDDGRREELHTSKLQRSYVLNALKAASSGKRPQRAKGAIRR